MRPSAPYASTSLADLLPAVRYADPRLVADRLDDARLPLTWWHATPLMEVERIVGAEALGHHVARTIRALWPHAELGDVLPVLRMLDEPGAEPRQTVAEVAREAGPMIEDGDRVLAAVFGAVLDRLHGRGAPRTPAGDDADVREAVSVIARWLPADAPAEVRAALAVLLGQGDSAGDTSAPAPAAATAASVSDADSAGVQTDPRARLDADSDPRAHTDTDTDTETVPEAPAPAPSPELMAEPLAAFGRFVSEWDDRAVAIAGRRMFADEPERLNDLGERFSVSRERIRQLERAVTVSVERWLASTVDGQAFAGHLAAVAERLGAVCRTVDVRALHPDHARTVDALGVPLGDVIARLLPGRTPEGAWFVEGDPDSLKAAMREELLAACGDAPLTWDEAVALGGRHGVRAEVLGDWAAELGRFRVRDGKLLHWGRSVGDRAAAVLALHGEPLSTEGIHDRLADGTAISSMRNQIWADERFIRLDRNVYGLRSWGGEEYLGIREMIAREIEKAGGEAEASAIAEALSARFDVSASSVRTNLGGPGFARTRRGWVRVADLDAEQDTPYVPRNDVSGTRRCFVGTDGRWWYRVEVTAEHLRGSGGPVPAGWAAHIGAAPSCEPVRLRHEAGETSLAWHAQPQLGSVKPLFEHIGACAGDQVFLNVTDSRLSALRLPAPSAGLAAEAGAARLTGWTAPVTPAEAVAVIARRIGMADGQDGAALLERLAERGDKDISELLEQALAGVLPAF
ncbi:hypothetical protein [Streptomyces sp. NRRL F-5126]|uniref:hypothetical protein n=1 Tax=Streptomyces sp. NRRL F-5126 TaxID=1463857 RepID=UPI00068BFF60|nr:hypothetical protein [Streptomyces sp. NRRL F-5126]